MSETVQSILTGTIGLDIALVLAAVIGWSRPIVPQRAGAARVAGAVTLFLQALHFGEETWTGFYVAFPAFLGRATWPLVFFAIFNSVWLAIWLAALAGAARAGRLAAIALWFLALAAIGNGIAHPLLALAANGYFPGLATAPFLGVAGLVLASRLRRAARAA